MYIIILYDYEAIKWGYLSGSGWSYRLEDAWKFETRKEAQAVVDQFIDVQKMKVQYCGTSLLAL